MPIIYQCGNCGDDHDDVEQARTCKVCGGETCTACQDNGSCWACADDDRTVDGKDEEVEDVEWEDS